MQVNRNNRPLCINCSHNPSGKCKHVNPQIKNGDTYPKVFECGSYKFTPMYIYQTEKYYGKFHTEVL